MNIGATSEDVVHDIIIARVSLKNRSVITMTCWSAFAVHGNGRKYSIAVNFDILTVETLEMRVFVFNAGCYAQNPHMRLPCRRQSWPRGANTNLFCRSCTSLSVPFFGKRWVMREVRHFFVVTLILQFE